MRLWRIGSSLYPVWSSTGARLKGGRWNLAGTPAIYVAASYALAALEILVYANIGRIPSGFRYVTIDAPDDVRPDHIAPDAVPGWDALPSAPPAITAMAGCARDRRWCCWCPPWRLTGLTSVRWINPLHSAFERIEVSDERAVQWDARLVAGAGRR